MLHTATRPKGLRSARWAWLLVAVLTGTAACRNPCQQLCVRLADYAEECGHTVPDAELQACIDDQADADDTRVCRQHGDAESIRREWTCEDLELYWGIGG